MTKIVLITSDGWHHSKDTDDKLDLYTTLVNANKQNKRGTEKSVTDYDAETDTLTIAVVKKEE